jgi:hypothetical protein
MTPLSAIGWGLSLPVGFRGPLTWPSAEAFLCQSASEDPSLSHRPGAFSASRLLRTPHLALGRGLPLPVGFREPLTWPSAGGFLCQSASDDPSLSHRPGASSASRLQTTPLSAIGGGLSLPVGFRGPLSQPSAGAFLCQSASEDPSLGHRPGGLPWSCALSPFSKTPLSAISRGLSL